MPASVTENARYSLRYVCTANYPWMKRKLDYGYGKLILHPHDSGQNTPFPITKRRSPVARPFSMCIEPRRVLLSTTYTLYFIYFYHSSDPDVCIEIRQALAAQ